MSILASTLFAGNGASSGMYGYPSVIFMLLVPVQGVVNPSYLSGVTFS